MTPRTRNDLIELIARALDPTAAWDRDTQCNSERVEAALSDAADALTAIEDAGCAVVPVEVTEGMVADEIIRKTPVFNAKQADLVYTAMLAASPFAKEEE